MPDNQPHKNRVIILTALPVEYKAVLAHLKQVREEVHPQGTIYGRGIFESALSTWDVGVAETGIGHEPAAFEGERAIRHFQPNVVLFVGVAGGLKDVKLGDVVAARKVYGYESGKEEEGGFRPRPNVVLSTYRMEQRAQAEARKGDWLQRLGQPLPVPHPAVYVGPIASGAKVVASTSSATWKFLKLQYGDTLAVDMEDYGLLAVARANPQIEALAIRGISDLIDKKSEADKEHSQEIAARHASAFAFEVLAKLGQDEHFRNEQVHSPSEEKVPLHTNLTLPDNITFDRVQREQFHHALLSAFPSRSELERMVDFGLGENLDAITSSSNLNVAVFELIKWAQAQGRLRELIRAAYKANAGNVQLRTFVSPIGLAGLTDS